MARSVDIQRLSARPGCRMYSCRVTESRVVLCAVRCVRLIQRRPVLVFPGAGSARIATQIIPGDKYSDIGAGPGPGRPSCNVRLIPY